MDRPWADSSLTPAARAESLLAELTLEEKVGLVHAPMGLGIGGQSKPPGALGSAGFNPGVPRLGWQRVPLDPGESSLASVVVDPRLLSRWDGGWSRPSGTYVVTAGAHAGDRPLRTVVSL